VNAAVDYALPDDLDPLRQRCDHIPAAVLRAKIDAREVVVARRQGQIVGWLTTTLLWDLFPFINLLVVAEAHRRQGIGRQIVAFVEAQARAAGAAHLLTSSQADEEGQHFWRAVGFHDVGGLRLGDVPLEIFFAKALA
jgi:GNAT superfamily N-acetyltransferase